MKYTEKKFSVGMGGSELYRENWERAFGKKLESENNHVLVVAHVPVLVEQVQAAGRHCPLCPAPPPVLTPLNDGWERCPKCGERYIGRDGIERFEWYQRATHALVQLLDGLTMSTGLSAKFAWVIRHVRMLPEGPTAMLDALQLGDQRYLGSASIRPIPGLTIAPTNFSLDPENSESILFDEAFAEFLKVNAHLFRSRP